MGPSPRGAGGVGIVAVVRTAGARVIWTQSDPAGDSVEALGATPVSGAEEPSARAPGSSFPVCARVQRCVRTAYSRRFINARLTLLIHSMLLL